MTDTTTFPEQTHDRCSPEELEWLTQMAQQNHYLAPTPMGDGKWAALSRFFFTCAIIQGDMFDNDGYSDRWCFNSVTEAGIGLAQWIVNDFKGEPHGWHRHPSSGRRRPDGDASREYINQ